ncbi:MAG TPA: cupin domain-containing protein [Thermoanaerobaculia bacterium]|nr:cupin domain-containing protein [Thermoanaerobaculia bacterium]
MSRAARLAAASILIVAAALGQDAGPVVRHYPAADVAAAFAKGAVLFDGAGGNYMIHASRREKPGMAEVHVKDADLIYVMEGSATFVTGGRVLEGKTTAPDEIRGTSIAEGQTRQLSKGDVIIVPKGTPHQFAETTNPFLYYVVKVR